MKLVYAHNEPQDLSSKPEDVAITLNGLSHIITPDLARDLAHDLIAMLNHSRPHIRKRAVIAVYKVFVKYPEIVPYGITRLRERLEDTDPGKPVANPRISLVLRWCWVLGKALSPRQ